MKNTLILVHGFMDSSKRMDFMARQFSNSGWKVLTPSLQPSNGTVSIETLAQLLARFIRENTREHERIDLIGFSMGGLICRYYLQNIDQERRTNTFITISTPHLGTFTAYLFPGIGVRQMRPKSAFLQNLNTGFVHLQNLVFVSFYTPYDLIILPASSSVVQFARICKVRALLHPLMVSDKRLLEKVIFFLTK